MLTQFRCSAGYTFSSLFYDTWKTHFLLTIRDGNQSQCGPAKVCGHLLEDIFLSPKTTSGCNFPFVSRHERHVTNHVTNSPFEGELRVRTILGNDNEHMKWESPLFRKAKPSFSLLEMKAIRFGILVLTFSCGLMPNCLFWLPLSSQRFSGLCLPSYCRSTKVTDTWHHIFMWILNI